MLRNEVLDTAGDLISKDRAAVYGDANESFEAIAAMWTAYLKNHIIDVSLNAADVAAMMVLMKVSRLRYAQEYMVMPLAHPVKKYVQCVFLFVDTARNAYIIGFNDATKNRGCQMKTLYNMTKRELDKTIDELVNNSNRRNIVVCRTCGVPNCCILSHDNLREAK